MSNRDDIKKSIAEEEKMSSGDGTIGSGDVDLEADDDTEETYNEFIENKKTDNEEEESE